MHLAGSRPGGVSPNMAHYLGELYRLGGHRQYVSPSALAAELDVSPPAVARMGGRLSERGLVDRKRYRGVRLTDRGEREALREIRYHRMSEAFLVNVLKYGWHEAHAMADALAKVAMSPLVVPLVANVTARPVTAPTEIRRLLVEQVTGVVRWRESVLYMKEHGVTHIVEIGAGRVLAGLCKRIDGDLDCVSVGTPETIEEFLKTL